MKIRSDFSTDPDRAPKKHTEVPENSLSASISKWLKPILIFVLIALLISGGWFYFIQRREKKQEIIQSLAAVAQLKTDQIQDWRRDQLEDAGLIVPMIQSKVQQFLAEPPGKHQAKLKRDLKNFLGNIAAQHEYDNILLVSPEGDELINLAGMIDYDDAYAVELHRAFETQKPVFLDLHSLGEDHPVHLTVISPLFSETDSLSRSESEPMAALFLIEHASKFLYPYIQSWPVESETAETLLFKQDGDDVLFLNELRHYDNSALELRISLTEEEVPAVQAVLGNHGYFRGIDYRGEQTAAYSLPIPDTSWHLLSKIDTREAFAEWQFQSVIMLILLIGLAGTFSGAVLMLNQREKKKHFRSLYQSETKRRSLAERQGVILQAIGDAVIAADAKGKVELMNQTAMDLTGWNLDDAEGLPLETVFSIIHTKSRKPVKNPFILVMNSGSVIGMANHTSLIAKNGEEHQIADSGAPIRDESGEISGVVIVFHDVTEEYRLREELRSSAALLSSIFDSIPDLMFFKDTQGNYISCNPSFERFTGKKKEEIIGRKDKDIFLENSPAFLQLHNSLLTKNEESIQNEEWVTFPGGEQRLLDTLRSPCKAADGTVLGMLGIGRDISKRWKSDKEKEELNEQMRHIRKLESVGRLAGGVAHDFNNMLSVIQGFAEISLSSIDSKHELKNNLNEILNAAKRSADITGKLLAFARKQTIDVKRIDLNETLEHMLTMLRHLIGENISLKWIPGETLWPIEADPSQIDQILTNLCINGRDAIDGIGQITIETENISLDYDYCAHHVGFFPGDFVVLTISDNGCGMDKETKENIFEPFFTTKNVGEGSGLGLSTVYGIVRQNEGFINLYSEIDKGSTFRIYLPRYTGDNELDTIKPRKPLIQGHNETILLVEDEQAIREMAAWMLEHFNYTVLEAESPSKALQIGEKKRGSIDLLLTDVVMPEMNGHSLTEELRKYQPDIKVLYMSGYTANVIVHQGVLDRGLNFLQKPFSQLDLAMKVREALDSDDA